jgi:hypothetical protein
MRRGANMVRVCQMNSRPNYSERGVLISLEKRQLDFLETIYMEDGISHSRYIKMLIDKEIRRRSLEKELSPKKKEPKKKGIDFGTISQECNNISKSFV